MNASLIINYQFTFGKIKQKLVLFTLFATTTRLFISYEDYFTKQHNFLEYLSCLLDNNVNGESVALKILKKTRNTNFSIGRLHS